MSEIMRSREFFDSDGNLDITAKGYEDLRTLCDIVLNTHYSYVLPVDREDLISVGMVKCLDLLRKSGFDSKRSSLKNYLYTGIRNEMKNYLYRSRKEVIEDDDILIGINEDKSVSIEDSDSLVHINPDIVESISKRIREFPRGEVLSTLRYMGFDVEESVEAKYYEEVEGIVCLILWEQIKKIRKNYQEY